jgi:hypothetical protein
MSTANETPRASYVYCMYCGGGIRKVVREATIRHSIRGSRFLTEYIQELECGHRLVYQIVE